MPERDIQLKGKVRQVGIFNFKDLYNFCYDFLATEGYDVGERAYKEKVSGESKDIEIRWEAKRKVSDYFQFMIKMDWRIIGLKKVKVKKGDKEVSMDSGDLEISFSAVLIKDYQSQWEDRASYKFLRGIYDKYIIRARVEQYEDKLVGETNELIKQVKSFLALEAK